MSLLNNLNPEQLKAVTYGDISTMILAGAGSGKTKVLTTRIAWLLSNMKCNSEEILAVTFTNKAAKEMRERLSKLIPEVNTKSMWIGTFHGLCNRILRMHYKLADLPKSFQIMDDGEQIGVIKNVSKEYIDLDPKELQLFINKNKEYGIRAKDVAIGKSNKDRMLLTCYYAYEKECQNLGVVDFAELLLRTFELLRDNANLLTYYQDKFKYVLVDEFQDTNKLQYKWLHLLKKNNIFLAVGDDDQSIYSFRGAIVANMKSYIKDFNADLIKLEQNYRSHQNILNIANASIERNSDRLGKTLWSAKKNGPDVKCLAFETEHYEADYIINQIKKDINNNVNLKEIAIIYRTNAQSRVIEQVLMKNHIPYVIYGGLRFFERKEIKDILCYLRILTNERDNTAFSRIVNIPTRGISKQTINKIYEESQQQRISMLNLLLNDKDKKFLAKKSKENVDKFMDLYNDLYNTINNPKVKLADKISYVLQYSGLLDYYQKHDDDEERVENLREFVAAADWFEKNEHFEEPLSDFLNSLVLDNEDVKEKKEDKNSVQLMTIHTSKGLEFESVYLCGLEQGTLPHDRSIGEELAIQEERRLFYVGVTRAKNKLIMSWCRQKGFKGYMDRSMFLNEVEKHFF